MFEAAGFTPAFENTTKIPREDPQRERKKNEMVAKKREIWAPHPSGPHPSGFHPSGPQRVFVLPCVFVVLSFFEWQEHSETVKLAKVGLAKVGHPNFSQSRSIMAGQNGSKFVGQSHGCAFHLWPRCCAELF